VDDERLGQRGRLGQILQPPDRPLEVPDPGAWEEVERALGIAFPADYKSFVATYGSGSVDDFLLVLNPFSSRTALRIQDFGMEMLRALRENRANGTEDPPFPIHPEPGGLFPWGATDNGDWCYWVTEPAADPDRWPVAVNMSRGPDWFNHPGPLIAFLADLLEGVVRVPFLPDDFPSDEPVFRQLD
jgi:hypothetical protein